MGRILLIILSIVLSGSAYAGDWGSVPSGAPGAPITSNTSNYSAAGSSAQNAGNSQASNCNSTQPARIETVGQVNMITPSPSANCYVVAGGSGGFLGGGFGVNAPILSMPCAVLNNAQITAQLGLAGYNMGDKERGTKLVQSAQELASCSDINMFLTRRAQGLECSVMPDPRILGEKFFGGMPDRVVKINPDYHPAPRPVPPPVSTYVPPDNNSYIDRFFEKNMKK